MRNLLSSHKQENVLDITKESKDKGKDKECREGDDRKIKKKAKGPM